VDAKASPLAAGTGDQQTARAQALADWLALKAWSDAQTGDRRAGADYWAANRNVGDHLSCAEAAHDYEPGENGPDPNRPGDKTAFFAGCQEAKRRLDPIDARQVSEPEYRAGFSDAAKRLPPASNPNAMTPPPAPAGITASPNPNPTVTSTALTPLVRYFQSLGRNCGEPSCPPNPMRKCADPATPDDANFCLGHMTLYSLASDEDIKSALGRPLYEKYMALKAEGIRLARENQAKQAQEANSPHPVVASTGIPWIAGALICLDVPTLTSLIDRYQRYHADYMIRRNFTEDQARIYYGAPILKPDPKSYGCVLAPPGTPFTRVRIILAYPFVRSVDPIDGVQVEGITFPTMIR
jgi:hypothetical protein